MERPIMAAAYMRLSKDDENCDSDSVSIKTQRTVIQQYAHEQNIMLMEEYVDDGYSGTNFNRPAFQRMIEDINAKKINCVITKDLSRFGREHVQMGYYLDFVFPNKNVRYIAIAENEDSAKGLSDFVPFKNLFNEWFAKDTSRKVKQCLEAKVKKGEHLCAYAPLGYKKDPANPNHLIIDDNSKWIVERIFDLAYHGAGASKITRQLIEEKVPTPSWIKYQNEGFFSHVYAGQPEEKKYMWTISQVKDTLKNEVYLGNTVYRKQGYISYKNKKMHRNSKEEWIYVPNTHEAIIDKKVFEAVREQINLRRRQTKDGTTQIFAGLVKCADCGWSLSYVCNRQKRKPRAYYHCGKYGQGTHQCTQHYIQYDTLYSVVLSELQYWIGQAHQDDGVLLSRLLKHNSSQQGQGDRRMQRDLAKAQKRLSQIDDMLVKAFEDKATGAINERTYLMLVQKYQDEQATLEGNIDKWKTLLSEAEQTTADAQKWVELLQQYTCPTELTSELLNGLIEKILVHEAVKGEDGTREQEIEIFYRFVGKIA